VLAVFPLALLLAACGGSEAASAPAAPPAAKNLFISADVVQGSTNVPQDQAALFSCVLSSRYARNSQMVFRARVSDPATGDLMDDQAVTKLEAKLANGKTLDMTYGLHPKNTGEGYWTGSWIVPKDAPTGTLKYTLSATAKDGRTGEFVPMSVASALPTITDQVLPDAAPSAAPSK
jgi:hypothetical protein